MSTALRSIRTHVLLGFLVLALLVGGIGGWAAVAAVESAVIAAGTVVVRGFQKRVQHQTGGTVATILVENGDLVAPGDVLIRLDGRQLTSEVAGLEKRAFDLRVRRHRLQSERDEMPWKALSGELRTMVSARPELSEMVAVQRTLLETRANLAKRRRSQLHERIQQSEEEIAGLQAIATAREAELKLLQDELEGLERLKERGLVQISRYNTMRRNIADKEGQIGQVQSQIAEIGGRITETELRIIEITETAQDDALKALETVEAEITQVDERLAGLYDRLEKLDIRATASGYIHEMTQHTIGGVVGPGETVSLIIPASDELVVDARVQTIDRDQVSVGMKARVRFSAFNQRTTPELSGRVEKIASDQSIDPATQMPHYKVRVVLSPEEVALLGNLKVVPGMPAEVLITSDERTVLTYLVKPVVDQFQRAFREQ